MKTFTYVIIAIISVIVLLSIILFILNHFFYKMFRRRFDGDIRFKFLTLQDYPNLKMDHISIKSTLKVNLNGGKFYYPNKEYKGVIIFYHGLYSGYINYLNIIEYLCKNDYIVIAFNMMGSMSSEGSSIKGMALGDKDNKKIIEYVINNKELNKYPLYVLGHSWGGHLALTSLIHDDVYIKKAVAICPYNSNVDCAYSLYPKAKILFPFLYLLNLIKFGIESTYKSTDAIKYSNSKIMIFSGGKDMIVKQKYSYDLYKKVAEENDQKNVTLKYYKDGNHFIYMSKEASEHFTKEISFPRNGPINFKNINYDLINKLNDEVMKEILNFFNN